MNKIYKIYNFSSKLIKEFFCTWKYWGGAMAMYNIVWWLCFYLRIPFAQQLSRWAIKKKTQLFDVYFSRHYGDIINRYKNSQGEKTLDGKIRIWVFWGQGEEKMPPLVKACFRQLTYFNDGVYLIAETNVANYIELNPIIYEKVKKGQISWAHFSDIIRTTLLAKYGGLWIDATVWISGKIPFDKLSQFDMFSPNGKVTQTSKSVQFWTSFEWNWSTWCLWSKYPQNRLFSFVSAMLQAIGEREEYWPDYVIQDYLIYYACRNFSDVQATMEQMQGVSGENRNEFAQLMNRTFDMKQYNELTSNDFAFKLSFRSLWKMKNASGEQTFYGRILEKVIEKE